jgi:hypothetical protein
MIRKDLSNTQKTSLFRMLYWKTHYSPIPKTEYHVLIGGGWLVVSPRDASGTGYTWSEEANRITNLFND